MSDQDRITYFAETDFRNSRIKFGIKAKDRTRHLYIIGKTGMGKSTMLENMIVQDIQNGEGVAVIDPHGSMAENLLDYIPENRLDDVIYFAPFDTDHPVSLNIMEDVGADKRHLVANGLMNAFKKIWVDAWSARMEYILNNVLLALLEYPNATILGVNRMLSDKDYREMVVANVKDASVKAFWEDEFAKYGDRYMQEAGAAIQNKIGQFVSNPLVRNIIGQPKSSFDVRKVMDEKKILIMNLSKGRMGIENSSLLGNMLVTKVYLGAMSRADMTPAQLAKMPNFYFYVDEFQSFANESFADILSEARKYKLCLTIAHQYVSQMPEEVRDAVFGNVGSMIAFRIGPEDAELFEKEFAPEFTAEDLVNLGFAQIYLRLMIDGIGSKPFSATTLPPISLPTRSFKDEVVAATRRTYATPRGEVEGIIKKWYEPVPSSKPDRDRRPKSGGFGGPRESVFRPARPDYRPQEAPPRIPFQPKRDAPQSHSNGQAKQEYREPSQAPKQAPVEQHPASPKPPQPVRPPISLAELKPKRDAGGPTKNTLALKEALEAAMREREAASKNVPPAEKAPEKQPEKPPMKQKQPEKPTEQKQPEKKEEKPETSNQGGKPNTANPDPKEVPEDVLRKLLGE